MNNGKSNGDGSVASKVLSPSHRSAAAATSGTSPVLVLAGVGGQQSASDAEHAGGSLRMDDGAVEGEGSRPPGRRSPSSWLQVGPDAAGDADAEALWKELIDEAAPIADRPGVFTFRGEAYKMREHRDKSLGKVQVVRADDGTVLWAGVVAGPLEGAARRLQAKLKQRMQLLGGPPSATKARFPQVHAVVPVNSSPNRPAVGDSAFCGENKAAHAPQNERDTPKPKSAAPTRARSSPRTLATSPVNLATHVNLDKLEVNGGAGRRLDAPTAAVADDELGLKWKQLLQREGFDDSFQNSILERVSSRQTVGSASGLAHASPSVQPAASPPPGLSFPSADQLSSSESTHEAVAPLGGGVSAHVEEVPAYLRGRVEGLASLSNVSVNQQRDDATSRVVGTDTPENPIFRSSPDIKMIMASDFTSSQGVKVRAGAMVTLVRNGQRGWTLVRDGNGLKSWVPQAYMIPADKELPHQTLNDHSGEIFSSVPAVSGDVRTAERPRAHRAASDDHLDFQVLNDQSGEIFNSSVDGPVALSDKVAQLTGRSKGEDEIFEAWIAERLGNQSGLAITPPQQETEIKQQWAQTLGKRVGEMQGMADLSLLVKLEQQIFKEREAQEKERYVWSLEKRRLETLLDMQEAVLEEHNGVKRRSTDRSLPAGHALDEDTAAKLKSEIRSLEQRLSTSHDENVALRKDIQELTEHVADRDIAWTKGIQGAASPSASQTALAVNVTAEQHSMQTELEVENTALKQHVHEQHSLLQQAEETHHQNRTLTVANAVLQKKCATLTQQQQFLSQKIQKLEEERLLSTSAVSGSEMSAEQMQKLILDLQLRCATLERNARTRTLTHNGTPMQWAQQSGAAPEEASVSLNGSFSKNAHRAVLPMPDPASPKSSPSHTPDLVPLNGYRPNPDRVSAVQADEVRPQESSSSWRASRKSSPPNRAGSAGSSLVGFNL